MKKIILSAVVFLILTPHVALSETVSLSTYYPAPFGTYDRIRLVPRAPLADPCRVGTFYTENVTNTLRYCTEVGDGPDDGDWLPMVGLWINDGTNRISLVNTATIDDFYVGIGDANADALLELSRSNAAHNFLMLSNDDNADGDVMIVTSAGNVGIGTTAPNSSLSVEGNVTAGNVDGSGGFSYRFRNRTDLGLFEDNGYGMHLSAPESVAINIDSNNNGGDVFFAIGRDAATANPAGVNTLLYMNEAGNLGLGLTNPSAQLQTNGNAIIGPTVPGAQERLNVDGRLNLRDDGANWGLLRVTYVAAAPSGYYAVYAP